MTLKLEILHHDNLENHDAVHITDTEYFQDDSSGTAHHKLARFLKQKGRVEVYLGWDGEVYPKFRVSRISIR